MRIDDPRGDREAEVGDTVDGPELRRVVLWISTPLERSSASSAARSGTNQPACVCSSAVPTVLVVTTIELPPRSGR